METQLISDNIINSQSMISKTLFDENTCPISTNYNYWDIQILTTFDKLTKPRSEFYFIMVYVNIILEIFLVKPSNIFDCSMSSIDWFRQWIVHLGI